jgi:phytol kinase
MGEFLRAALVGAAVLAIFGAAGAWRRRAAPPTEWTRKAVHLGTGLVVASLPWVLASPWTVLILGALFALLLRAARRLRLLPCIHAVARRSEGDLYYLAGVCMLFVIAHRQPLLYLIAVLVLAVADPAAALVGASCGRRAYALGGERRTLEGSLAFCAAAFACAALPLALCSRLGPGAALGIAAGLAVAITGVEAVSRRGSDNLLIPLATYLLLAVVTEGRPA